jgi:hypothetical protein
MARAENGEGTGGGMSVKGEVDKNWIASMSDEEIGKYAFKALREKLLGNTETGQKVISESNLEEYLAKGWKYVNSLNNGSHKCVVASARYLFRCF